MKKEGQLVIDPTNPVEVGLGRLCNNKCIFCMSGEERDLHEPWASLERTKSEIKALYQAGARSLILIGGEPTVYPYITEAIQFARDLGYVTITLDTNGVRFANSHFLNECIQAGLSRVTMSVHSHIATVEEFLVGVPGVLEKKLQAIDNLVERRNSGFLRDGLGLNPVLCRPNAQSADDYVRFFMERGIRDIRFNFIWPESRVQKDKRVVPAFHEAVPAILKLILLNEKEWRTSISFGAVPYCVLPPALQRNQPLLFKYFCESRKDLKHISTLYAYSNGERDRFEYDWVSREHVRAKVPACVGCSLDSVCMGIYRSYLELYGDDEFQAIR